MLTLSFTETRVHLLDVISEVDCMLLLGLRCVVEILMFIVHWYVTSKALVMIASGIPCSDHRVESEFCSGIASLDVPNLEGKHWPSMQNKFAYQGKSPLWRGSCIQ